MASAEVQKGEETVPDPTLGKEKIKKNATVAAEDLLEGLRCLDMMSDYRQCISANFQFHQYYIHGKFSKCKVQKSRMFSCMKWRTSQNQKAREELLKSFEDEQLSMHAPQPVWEFRDQPPSEWSSPDSETPPPSPHAPPPI